MGLIPDCVSGGSVVECCGFDPGLCQWWLGGAELWVKSRTVSVAWWWSVVGLFPDCVSGGLVVECCGFDPGLC